MRDVHVRNWIGPVYADEKIAFLVFSDPANLKSLFSIYRILNRVHASITANTWVTNGFLVYQYVIQTPQFHLNLKNLKILSYNKRGAMTFNLILQQVATIVRVVNEPVN